jgi:hypothetical protein
VTSGRDVAGYDLAAFFERNSTVLREEIDTVLKAPFDPGDKMNLVSRASRRQRADYTHKFNATTGRHGWLRLTPAYSVKIVEELMRRFEEPLRVLDPFCGTATTALSAAYRGHEGVTTDVNPFLVWLGQVKTGSYSPTSLVSADRACARVLESVKRKTVAPVKAPPIHNIERWWTEKALEFLCRLKAGIETESMNGSPERALLLIAFCRTLIGLSNAAFDHQSMSFKDHGQVHLPLDADLGHGFSKNVRFVLEGAENNPTGSGHVVFGDSRNLQEAVEGPFDLIITSPPYANRMSYIRELRPYMYWLGFLDNGRDAGELDWTTIGGTWGIATSRLLDWERSTEPFRHPLLDEALDGIKHHDNRNGRLLANYVAKYFDDIWKHLNSLISVLNDGGEIHYIVGNSTFYNVLLSTEKLYAAMLERLGFERITYRAIRKRNSKKALFEFDVSARWAGQKQ